MEVERAVAPPPPPPPAQAPAPAKPAPPKPAPPKPAKPAAAPPPRRSLLIPAIAVLTLLIVLSGGIFFLRAKPPDRAPVQPVPAVATPVPAVAPQPDQQPAAALTTSPPTVAETVAPAPSEKPKPAPSPASPPARSPATARAERPQGARDLPVEQAPAEAVPPPARQSAAAAAPPPEKGSELVATTAAPVIVEPAPAPVALAPTAPAPVAPAEAAPAPGPTYVADKFQFPRPASRTCIAEKLRLPAQLDDNAPEVVTVRIAVGATGVPTQVQVLGSGLDPMIADAIRRAALACEWIPGTDAQGKPALFWAVQPIRLAR